jgi:hypothetical protein
MGPSQPLEKRLREVVHQLLKDGDSAYLQALSRTAFIDALEHELRFLGLYRHNDAETPARIHAFVEEHIDQWRLEYLSQQPEIPVSHIEVETSPFARLRVSTSAGILRTRIIPYISFTSPPHDPHMQISPNPA